MPPNEFEPLKLITAALAFLLLAPIGIEFWRIIVFRPTPPAEQRAYVEAALQKESSRIGTITEDGAVVAQVLCQFGEAVGFSERTHSWLSFYPRRWMGIVGLLAVIVTFACLMVSLFMPVVSELSTP